MVTQKDGESPWKVGERRPREHYGETARTRSLSRLGPFHFLLCYGFLEEEDHDNDDDATTTTTTNNNNNTDNDNDNDNDNSNNEVGG